MPVAIHPLLFKVTGVIAADLVLTEYVGVIRHVIWNGATTGGHKAALKDTAGNIIWEAEFQVVTTGGDSRICDRNLNLSFAGLKCDDLDSGELLIYYDVMGG